MDESCRLCRKKTDVFSVSLLECREGMQIAEIVMQICPIKIEFKDLHPKKICDECLEISISAHELRKTAIASDVYFRSSVSECLNTVDVKEELPEAFLHIKIENVKDEDQFYSDNDIAMTTKTFTQPAATTFNPRPVAPDEGFSMDQPCNKIWYMCNFCDKKLRPRWALVRHMMALHDPITKPFSCKFCTLRYDDEEKRDSHMSTSHDRNEPAVHFCGICGATGINAVGMQNHKIDDHPQMVQQLPEIAGNSSITLAAHHPKRRRPGKFHPRPFPGSDQLSYNEIWYSCNFCDKKLKPRKNMVRHIKSKHDPDNLPFGCRLCIERFDTSAELESHETNHDEGGNAEIFFCEICGISGDNFTGMNNHKTDDHKFAFSSNFAVPNATLQDNSQQPPVPVMGSEKKTRGYNKFNPRPLRGYESLSYREICYSCSFCSKKMRPRKTMMRHIKQKHDPEIFPLGCRFCLQRFTNEADCSQHEDENHGNETPSILFCDICNVSGDKKEGMRKHIEDDHLKLTQMRRSRKRKSTEIQPERPTVVLEDKVKCEKCDKRYTRNKLRYHVMMVHDKSYRLLEPQEVQHEMRCCACHQEFNSEEALLNHLEVHRADYNNSPCNHCPIPPKTFDHFLAHCKHHLKPKTHLCLQCNKIFPFDGKLMAHITGHKRMENYRNISCKKCDGKFRSVKDLEVHDKIKHHNLTLFVCPHCAKSMSTSGALDNHIRFVHNKEKEKTHECKICSKRFINKFKLSNHETTHSSERPHVCEQCGAAFKTSDGLVVHMKRHNGTLKKRFSCNQCSLKFTSMNRLQTHLLTHTGEKPHGCQFCDNAYASKGDLIKHLQKVHVGNAVYRCEKEGCNEGFPRMVELREHMRVHRPIQ